MGTEIHEIIDLKDELTGRIKNYLSGFLRALVVGLLVLIQFIIIALAPFVLRNFTIYFLLMNFGKLSY